MCSLYNLQFQNAHILLSGILFTILVYPCFVFAMVSHASNNKFGILDHFSSKSLKCSLLTCRSSVKRIRIKRTSFALSFIPTPPGVDFESKLSNMFVFDFALLDSTKLE